MFRNLSRKKLFLICILIVSLIIITISPSETGIQYRSSDTQNSIILHQGKSSLPYLPAEKTTIEQMLAIIQQQNLHFNEIPRLLLPGLCSLAPLPLMFAVLFFMYYRNLLLSCYNPVKSRIIRYIHHKEDHR